MLLTLDEVRQFVTFPVSDDADDALQLLLDATEADILAAAGASDASGVELIRGGWDTLILSRPISSVSAVVDDVDGSATTLASDDYRFTAGGYVLYRLSTGTHPGGRWGPLVQVTYTSPDTLARYQQVQAQLVRLALGYNPGLLSTRVGDWQETYQATNSVSGYATERESLLSTLSPGPSMVVL